MQTQAEGRTYGIPVNICSNPRTFNGWTNERNLAIGATFDTELAKEVFAAQAEQFRAVGVTTLLGPQVDLATEPRWSRVVGTFGEDPALSRDMADAAISGLQSTYDEDGNDLGWGEDSVACQLKHFPGDGAAEAGRESHNFYGEFTVYPGDAFETSLIPFVDGGLNLSSETGETAAIMPSYSIAFSDDGSLGELVGSSYSEYKINLLREKYGYAGMIITDADITKDTEDGGRNWGVEDLTEQERDAKLIVSGVDQILCESNVDNVIEAAGIAAEELGEDAILPRMQESARRITKMYFKTGIFENPYLDSDAASSLVNSDEKAELAAKMQKSSIVMLKNSGNVIKASESDEKQKVYIPMKFSPATTGHGATPASWDLPVDQKTAETYYEIVTDTVGDPTGPEDEDGNPTYTENDIIRATKEELADCTGAIVIIDSPQNGSGYDEETETYYPLSLQYGEYTADGDSVRKESLAGTMVTEENQTPYGVATSVTKENRSYFGETSRISNTTNLDGVLYAKENMPEDATVTVCVNADNSMIFSEFEDQVDAILIGFGIDNEYFLDVTAGKSEPTGLLPLQMPANMDTVEAQYEDVPRDMECYVDADGNTYDFAFGMNWSGVIQDERTEKYVVEPLTAPQTAE